MNRKPTMAGAGRPKAKKGTLKRVLKFLVSLSFSKIVCYNVVIPKKEESICKISNES